MEADEIRDALAQHGAARKNAAAARAAETAAITALAPKAIDAGLTKLEVARLAQISRVTLDAMLKPD